MEFIGVSFNRFMEWAFDDKSEAKPKNKITKDYCDYCAKSCHKRCECRCHVVSCKRCDYKECDYKKCNCECHKYIPQEIPVVMKQTIVAEHTPEQPIRESAKGVNGTPIIENIFLNKNTPDKPRKNILTAFLEKRRRKSKINEEGIQAIKKPVRIGSLVISKTRDSEKTFSPMVKFKPAKKSLAADSSVNISKDNVNINVHNVSRHENISVSDSKLSSSFKVTKNPFIVSSIKKRIESMKFKDLAIHPNQTMMDNSLNIINSVRTNQGNSSENKTYLSNNHGPSVNSFSPNIKQLEGVSSNSPNKLNNSYQGDLIIGETENYSRSPLNNSVNMSVNMENPALSPIPPGKNNKIKPHLNYSFDLNNSKLYQSKSSVVRKMEEMTRELDVKKQKDKDNQVKKVMKGFETQDAWQMYNSLIFANPVDLPEAKDIRKSQERPLIGDRSKLGKTGALTSQSKRK
jgi:hypothetical protein